MPCTEQSVLLSDTMDTTAVPDFSRDASNLYVSNLPHKANDDWLRVHFSSFGLITSAKVMVEHGRNKVDLFTLLAVLHFNSPAMTLLCFRLMATDSFSSRIQSMPRLQW